MFAQPWLYGTVSHRFIVKHLSDLLKESTPQGAAADGMLDVLKENFPVLIFSCVQLSSKLSFLGHVSSDKPLQSCVSHLKK